MIGTRLGKWVIDSQIGRGGMGRVYLAHEDGGQHRAAIKILAGELALEPGFLQRFEREIEILSRLSHPNIVKFYDAGAQDGQFYYAMEYVDGKSFEEILLANRRIPWTDVLDAAVQICPALKHAHDHGVIHRDIKPPNLLRGSTGMVKLTDFGIAKVFAGRQLTHTGGVVGTAEYLSPEQASGKQATKRSDLYSLGAVMYTLLVGRPPFSGATTAELLHKHIYARFDRPQKMVPEIPHELDEIVCQLLEKDPARRPPDSLVLHRQLDSLRRKMERKGEITIHGLSKDRTLADNQPEAGEAIEGPATFASRMVRSELEEQRRDRTLFQWSSRPWVLAAMFVCCLGILLWTFWPGRKPDSEELFRSAANLMSSSHPEDWDEAWNKYLAPLEQLEGSPHHDQIVQFKQKIDDRANLRRALAGLKSDTGALSEGQRFYQRGLRLCRLGDYDAARQVWQNLIDSFEKIDSEARWVQLARAGLSEIGKKEPRESPDHEAALDALGNARQLKKNDKRDDAEKILKGLRNLYQDDPSSTAILKQIEDELKR